MNWAANNVYDSGLSWLQTNVNRLWIQPSSVSNANMQAYAASDSAKVGQKTSLVVSAPGNRSGGGREVTIPTISDGSVTVNEGVAARYQLVTSGNAIALWNALGNSQTLYTANGFTLQEFKVGLVSVQGWLNNTVFDSGLSWLQTTANKNIWLLSQAPASNTFASADSVRLANRDGVTVTAPADRAGGGREVEITSITGGTVTTQGTASHWALVTTTGSILMAWGTLTSNQIVYTANGWSSSVPVKMGLRAPV